MYSSRASLLPVKVGYLTLSLKPEAYWVELGDGRIVRRHIDHIQAGQVILT